MKLLLAILFLFISMSAVAAPAKALPKKKSVSQAASQDSQAGQTAVVKTDSAMVYEQPSFDSSVISYLPAGHKVRISVRTFRSDIGLFYMIRLPNKKIGYIADIDVQPMKSKKKNKHEDENRKEEVAKEREREKEREKEKDEQKTAEADQEDEEDQTGKKQREPVAFTPWIGPYYANWEIKEKIPDIDADERLSVFGIKYTTPKLLPGAILDLNLGVHFGAPSYYNQVSIGSPTGYIVLIDAEFLSPMILSQDSFGYFGLGPLINYTAIRIQTTGNAAVDSNDLRLGAALTLGYSHRLGPLCGRLEGKYIIEKTQQTVLVLSLQTAL